MSQVSKSVKLLYCNGEKLTVETMREFVKELDQTAGDEELDVSIESSGQAFTIEGLNEGV